MAGMAGRPYVSIVFPCLNEEESIRACVLDAYLALEETGYAGEVVVVDNGSADRSAELAHLAGARVLKQPQPGYGAALRTGIEYARGELVVMLDADGTYEIGALGRMLAPITSGDADLVVGNRMSNATKRSMPFLHRFVGTPILTRMVRHAADGLSVRDSQSGFRAFRKKAIQSLDMSSTGMEFASEMLVRASWARLRITEIDTCYTERVGQSKLRTFADGWRHLRQLFLLAPDMLAIGPGILFTLLGLVGWCASFVAFGDNVVGSYGWQTLHLSQSLLVLGPLMIMIGFGLRFRAALVGLRPKAKVARHIVPIAGGLGILLLVTGIGLDLALSLHGLAWHFGASATSAMAGLISALLIDGAIFAAVPILYPIIARGPSEGVMAPRSEIDFEVEPDSRFGQALVPESAVASNGLDIDDRLEFLFPSTDEASVEHSRSDPVSAHDSGSEVAESL